jgi:predicted HicB family RNase H-like nuclease
MTRSDLIYYKNYYGSVHFDPQEELFFGKIEFIRDLVNYEASEAKSLISFGYIPRCLRRNMEE